MRSARWPSRPIIALLPPRASTALCSPGHTSCRLIPSVPLGCTAVAGRMPQPAYWRDKHHLPPGRSDHFGHYSSFCATMIREGIRVGFRGHRCMLPGVASPSAVTRGRHRRRGFGLRRVLHRNRRIGLPGPPESGYIYWSTGGEISGAVRRGGYRFLCLSHSGRCARGGLAVARPGLHRELLTAAHRWIPRRL